MSSFDLPWVWFRFISRHIDRWPHSLTHWMEISWQQYCFSIMLSFRRLTQTTKNVYFMYELKEPMYASEIISARTLTHTYTYICTPTKTYTQLDLTMIMLTHLFNNQVRHSFLFPLQRALSSLKSIILQFWIMLRS